MSVTAMSPATSIEMRKFECRKGCDIAAFRARSALVRVRDELAG